MLKKLSVLLDIRTYKYPKQLIELQNNVKVNKSILLLHIYIIYYIQ